MQAYYTIFDIKNRRVGLVESVNEFASMSAPKIDKNLLEIQED